MQCIAKLKFRHSFFSWIHLIRAMLFPYISLPLHNVLSSIVSRLSLRDAIRTSVLSRQWKHLWCDHPNLRFHLYMLERRRRRGSAPVTEHDLIALVNRVLHHHSGTGVDLLKVSCALHNEHAHHIDRWVKFAIASKAESLVLRLSKYTKAYLSAIGCPAGRPERYSFPCHLFGASNDDGSYLRCLQLSSVSLNLPAEGFNGFPNLTKLTMLDVKITDQHLECLLSKCSLLEFLGIACCTPLTTLRAICPLNRLKHLKVQDCRSVKNIEMNCGLITLKYSGPMVPLQFATTSSLRNVHINLFDINSTLRTFRRLSMISDNIAALDYITTGFPSTLQHLETLKLSNDEYKMTTSPVRLVNFIYLRHLRLELNIFGGRKTDALDYAYLLDCAPSLEKLELHMWMQQCGHVPYREEHGELRRLPWHPHTHLKSVHITGFFGHKDQVELALHILRCSTMLEAMKIDCRVTIMPEDNHSVIYKTREYLDGYLVATAFVQAADQNNVVEVLGARKVFFTDITDGRERFYFVS